MNSLAIAVKALGQAIETPQPCACRACIAARRSPALFIVCGECGNKRCPHATDHRHACTGSNEPGQAGNVYE